ncbi:MAG: hypothetical protein AB1782_19015 [Cyanobacteriota bacterium]
MFQKGLIATLSLLIAFLGIPGNTNIVKCTDNNQNPINNNSASILLKLFNTTSWKKINYLWKEINHLENIEGYQEKENKAIILNTGYEKIIPDIDTLKKQGYLTNEECIFIKALFENRLNHLKRKYAPMTCYIAYPSFASIQDNLEQRFDILEKLFNENKISSEAFKTAKNEILNDLKKKDSKYNNIEINDNFLDLAVYLNK